MTHDLQEQIETRRMEALKKLHATYETTHCTSGREDFDAMMESPNTILRWALVTVGGENIYISTHHTEMLAEAHAIANLDDTTFAESPVAIADLDSGFFRTLKGISIFWDDERHPLHDAGSFDDMTDDERDFYLIQMIGARAASSSDIVTVALEELNNDILKMWCEDNNRCVECGARLTDEFHCPRCE